MSIPNNRSLLFDQIGSLQNEILLTRLTLGFFNSVGLIALGFVFKQIANNPQISVEGLNGYLEAAAAIFTPYLAFVTTGFSHPKMRKLRSLRSLQWKINLEGCEHEIIYDK